MSICSDKSLCIHFNNTQHANKIKTETNNSTVQINVNEAPANVCSYNVKNSQKGIAQFFN